MRIHLSDARALKPLAEQVGQGSGQGQFRTCFGLTISAAKSRFVLPGGIDVDAQSTRSALKLVLGGVTVRRCQPV